MESLKNAQHYNLIKAYEIGTNHLILHIGYNWDKEVKATLPLAGGAIIWMLYQQLGLQGIMSLKIKLLTVQSTHRCGEAVNVC